jgi:hypothetical protein
MLRQCGWMVAFKLLAGIGPDEKSVLPERPSERPSRRPHSKARVPEGLQKSSDGCE